jgi:hypothetical protein
VLLSPLLCFHPCCLSFTARLASFLTTSSGKVTPHGSLRTHPRPYSMRAAGVNKGGNQHNRVTASSNGLTQGLPTPSLREVTLGVEVRHDQRARNFQTRASTSASISSAEKERSGLPSLGYLHIVISHHRSSWTRQLMKVRRMSVPNSPSQSMLLRMSSTGHRLWMSFLATSYPQLG